MQRRQRFNFRPLNAVLKALREPYPYGQHERRHTMSTLTIRRYHCAYGVELSSCKRLKLANQFMKDDFALT